MKKRLQPEFDLAFEDANESTGFLFWQLSNVWQRRMKGVFESVGLTHVQYLLLNSLATMNKTMDKPINQSLLSEHSGCDKMMVSKVIRTMEANKLVIRKAHHSDSRSISILLTQKGMEQLKQATILFVDAESGFFKPLKGKQKEVEKRIKKLLKQAKKKDKSDSEDEGDSE
jgi:DNA-binding MarR family transcriptional regulator